MFRGGSLPFLRRVPISVLLLMDNSPRSTGATPINLVCVGKFPGSLFSCSLAADGWGYLPCWPPFVLPLAPMLPAAVSLEEHLQRYLQGKGLSGRVEFWLCTPFSVGATSGLIEGLPDQLHRGAVALPVSS